jgi:hypothetical protein
MPDEELFEEEIEIDDEDGDPEDEENNDHFNFTAPRPTFRVSSNLQDALNSVPRRPSNNNSNAIIQTGITFGVEFESDVIPESFRGENNSIFNIWRLTHDASTQSDIRAVSFLNGGSWLLNNTPNIVPSSSASIGSEFVSKIIDSEQEDYLTILENLIDFLEENGEPDESTRTSVHVHVSLSNPNLRILKNIIYLGKYLEGLFFRIGGMGYNFRGEKNDSNYCRPITNVGPQVVETSKGYSQLYNVDKLLSAKTFSEFWNWYGNTDRINQDRYLAQRYTWLNLFGLYPGGRQYRGTLEFRIFNKTLNPYFIYSIIKLCLGFTQLCSENPKELREIHGETNSAFDSYSSGELVELLLLFDRFGKLDPATMDQLINIINITPPVKIEKQLVFSHLRELPTYWPSGECPYENIDRNIVKRPNYTDIHVLRGERRR